MRCRITEDGGLHFDRLEPLVVEALAWIPELLGGDDPQLRDALLPRTYQDDADEAQWRRLVRPELEHLFASRAELVRGDLRGLSADDGPDDTLQFELPAAHRPAWIAALNGANHALLGRYGVTAAELAGDPTLFTDRSKQLAAVSMEVYSMLLAALLEVDGYSFPGRDVVDGWREVDQFDDTDDDDDAGAGEDGGGSDADAPRA